MTLQTMSIPKEQRRLVLVEVEGHETLFEGQEFPASYLSQTLFASIHKTSLLL